jgi:Flp pilus assembly pilin Flp
MQTMKRLFGRLRDDASGFSAVELALLGPLFLIMLLGVLQVGIAMQNYNALRNVSADVARYAMVQHQTGNNISNSQIRSYAISEGQGPPYLLRNRQLNALASDAATQRVDGAREVKLVMSYQIDSLLDFVGIKGPFITYTRPIFLVDD